MEKDLYLEIVSPDKTIYHGNVDLVEVPGQQGRFTILRNHAPIISVLVAGQIRIGDKQGQEQLFDCKAGYVECADNKVTVLLNN